MNNNFVPSHYAQCIDKYEIDLSKGCSVNCCYCSLKTTERQSITIRDLLQGDIPQDLKEKGIYLSPNSDPFSKSVRDKAHQLLEIFLPQGVPFLIITKSFVPPQTIALLAKYPSQVYVQISLSRTNDELNSLIEPGAASAKRRLQTMHSLLNAGIRVTPVLMPLFPGIDDTQDALSSIITACADAGARYLKAAYVVIEHTNAQLVKKMTANDLLRQSFRLMTEYQKIHVGGGMILPKVYRTQFYERITQVCADHGIRFQACPILDPMVLETDHICLCATYRKKQSPKH